MAGGELIRAADCHLYLLLMQDLIDASRLPPPKSLQNAKVADVRIAKAAQSGSAGRHEVPAQHVGHACAYARPLKPTRGPTPTRNLILAAIAAKRYQLKHGEFPQNLDADAEFLPDAHRPL